MNFPDSPETVLELLAALAVGIALGIAFFSSLRRNVQLYAGGRTMAAALLHMGRFALVIAVLAAAVRFGAGPLIACAVGLVLARFITMRRLGETP